MGDVERDRRVFGGVEEWGDKSLRDAYPKGLKLDLGDAGEVDPAALVDPFEGRPSRRRAVPKVVPRAPGV